MANLWETNGGIFLGFGCENTEGTPPAINGEPLAYRGDRHVMTIGPNGSGKSRRLLLPNLARLIGWSKLVVDPKGELCAMTAEHLRKAGNQVIILNPFNTLRLGSTGCNPLGSLDPGTDNFADDALEQAESNVKIEGREPHFGYGAQELVAALIMYVRLVIPDGSYGDVRALLGKPDKEFREMVNAPSFDYIPARERNKPNPQKITIPGIVAAGVLHDWEEIGTKAARFGDLTPENREMHGVIATALTQTRWLDSRPVKADLAKAPFDFSIMKDRPVTVFLVLPARRLVTHSTWLRLIIATIMQSLVNDTRRAKVPVLFMLDEFAQLGHLPIVENNLAMLRGYGIKLWTVFQDLSQAKRLYGREGFESFVGNAGVLQTFAAQDVDTAEYFSQRTGQTTRQLLSLGSSRNINQGQPLGSQGYNLSLGQIPMPLMLPQDVRNMEEGFSILFSHKIKGTVRSYLPFPTELPMMKSICALDPAA